MNYVYGLVQTWVLLILLPLPVIIFKGHLRHEVVMCVPLRVSFAKLRNVVFLKDEGPFDLVRV